MLTYLTNHSVVCNQRCLFVHMRALLVMWVDVNIYPNLKSAFIITIRKGTRERYNSAHPSVI